MSHDVQGHPRQVIVKYSEKIWSTNSKSLQYSFLLSHEPYEKAKLYDIWRWAPQIRCPVCSWWKSRGQLLIAPERMKQLGQSRNDAQLWMKGNQHWVVIGRADDEASIFWSPHVKSWLNGKKKNLELWERLKVKDRGKGQESITNAMDMNLSKLREIVKDREVWHVAVQEVAKNQTRFCRWTTMSLSTYHTQFRQNSSHEL